MQLCKEEYLSLTEHAWRLMPVKHLQSASGYSRHQQMSQWRTLLESLLDLRLGSLLQANPWMVNNFDPPKHLSDVALSKYVSIFY